MNEERGGGEQLREGGGANTFKPTLTSPPDSREDLNKMLKLKVMCNYFPTTMMTSLGRLIAHD